jgi:intracellular septation protein
MTKKSSQKNSQSWINFLCDYLPVLAFFITYKFVKVDNPLITATIVLMVATVISLVISYVATKKIAKMALFSGGILAIFGLATIIFHDETFIKIKPTIINSVFAAILFYCYFFKKLWLQNLLGSQLQISSQAWLTLSVRWACFFAFLAFLNEIIWRNFPTDFWVQFKVFGMMPISVIFTISQMPFMMRQMKEFVAKNPS